MSKPSGDPELEPAFSYRRWLTAATIALVLETAGLLACISGHLG